MLTLGIETSCDETSCAVLEGKDKILSNIVSSSLFRHKPFGGVVPEIAARHSLEQIDTVLQEALDEAKVKAQDLDLVAVTYGPGLIGSLFVGVSFAKALSYQLGIPLVGVNHLEAHLVANFIGHKEPKKFIGLLISGGHTSLSYHQNGKMNLLGETVDDAVGEAFDKVGKILGLGFPGGPLIEKLAREGNSKAFRFTKPKQKSPFDFSFSGIKTAVRYLVEGELKKSRTKKLSQKLVNDISASFQESVTDWLRDKTILAATHKQVKDVIVGGGVSANGYLREKLTQALNEYGIKTWFPGKGLSVDNAAMIARRGVEVYTMGRRDKLSLTGVPNLAIA